MRRDLYPVVFISVLASCSTQLPSPPPEYKDCLDFSQSPLGEQDNPFNLENFSIFGFTNFPNIRQRNVGKALDLGREPFPIAIVARNEKALASSMWVSIEAKDQQSATAFVWDIDDNNEGLPDVTLDIKLTDGLNSLIIETPTGLPIAALGLMGSDAGLVRWCKTETEAFALPSITLNVLKEIKIPDQL